MNNRYRLTTKKGRFERFGECKIFRGIKMREILLLFINISNPRNRMRSELFYCYNFHFLANKMIAKIQISHLEKIYI